MKFIKQLIIILIAIAGCKTSFAQSNVIKAAAGTDITTLLQTDVNTYKEVIIDGSLGSNVISTTITIPSGVKLKGINNASIVAANTITGTLLTNMYYFLFPSTTNNSSISHISLAPSSVGFSSLDSYRASAIYIQGASNTVDHCNFNFSFSNPAGDHVYGIWVSGASALYNQITYNSCTTVGIQYAESGASYTYCANNYIKNSGHDGLQGTGNTPTSPCKGNVVMFNTVDGAGFSGIEDQQYIDGTVIAYNHILSSGKKNQAGNKMGISAVGANTQVIGNDVRGFGDFGIEVIGGQGLLVKDNYVADTTNTWVDIYINSISANRPEYINATAISDNVLVGGLEGIHHVGNMNVMLNITGNKIKDTKQYGVYYESDGVWATTNILHNFFDFTKPNTLGSNAILTYTGTPATAKGILTIDKNIITYETSASGGSGVNTGITCMHTGSVISNNMVNTNNITAGSLPVIAYSANAGAANNIELRENKLNGTGNISINSYTNPILINNNWVGGNKTGGIVAASDLTSLTAANASVSAFTNSNTTGTFRISPYLNITSVTTDVIQMQVNYTDENNVTRTAIFYPLGKTTAGLNAIGNNSFPSIDIRSRASTTITVTTSLTTGGGSINYDAGATITQLR
jgi:hypothetical protein